MDPATIFSLIVTASDLSQRLYGFFKALSDAPEEVQEYLAVLERIRALFLEVNGYVQEHQRSSFNTLDRIYLTIVEKALKDCELEFTLQLSLVQNLDVRAASSMLGRAQRRTKWVLKKETIEGLTRKLEKSQGLLSESIIVSSGRNEIAIRHRLEFMSSDIKQALLDREKEAAEERARLLSHLNQFTHQLETRIGFLLNTSQEQGVRSDASLDNLSRHLSVDTMPQLGPPAASDLEPLGESNNQGGRHGEEHTFQLGHRGTSNAPVPSPAIAQDESIAPHAENVGEDKSANETTSGAAETQQTPEQQAGPSRPDPKVFALWNEPTATTPELPDPMEEAVKLFSRTQPASSPLFGKTFGANTTLYDKQRMFSDALESHHNPEKPSVSRIASKIARLTNVASAYADVFIQSSPASAAITWETVKFITQVVADSSESMKLMEVLEEMADAVETCGREYALYQDPKIHGLLVSVYWTLLSISQLCRKYTSVKKPLANIGIGNRSFREELDSHISEMRKGNAAILREVDYRHRVEMRNSSRHLIDASAEHQKRLVEVQVKQHKILNAVEEQREILEALREERTILKVVHEQQKILQAVQQIQMRLREVDGPLISSVVA